MSLAAARDVFSKILGSGVRFPTPHEARWITDQTEYSPDYGYLEQFEFQLLFSADDTKIGHSHHCLVEDSAFVANAFTTQHFNYWYGEIGQDRIPIPMLSSNLDRTIRYFPPPLKIQGQVHAIRPYQFLGLDIYKRNTVQFRRKRVNLIVPYREVFKGEYMSDDGTTVLPYALQGKKGVHSPEKVYILRAWMYVGEPKYWDGLLDAGYRGFKTVDHYESRREWLKEYYAYRKFESS